MKKYKNFVWSTVLGVIALIISYITLHTVVSDPWLSVIGLIPSIILGFMGILFGFKSIRTKESTWAGYLGVLLGLVALFLLIPILLFIAGFSRV